MGLVTVILQLPSFLDANSVERIVVYYGGILNANPMKNLSTMS